MIVREHRSLARPIFQTTSRSRREVGFSIFEIMVGISILSIVAAAFIPTASQWSTAYDKRNAEMLVLQDLRRGQATTVEQGCQGIMTIAGDGESYTFGCDYVPFSEESPPVYDTQIFSRSLPTGISVSAGGLIMFNSRGQVVDEDGFLTTQTLTLSTSDNSGTHAFNTGTMTATGFFSFDH